MLLRRYIFPLLLLLVCGRVFSQIKSLQAIKVSQAPKIDGSLDDPAWQNVQPATDFIQNFPNAGQPASQKTEVKIIYDDEAIYVGAYLYDDPALIRKQITARDDETQKDLDFFSVFFDTYNDKQNGFQFLVTSSNVQTDARLAPNATTDEGDYGDKTWDAVWDSKVTIKENGWVVEMKIPYTTLRFAKKDIQEWGVQFLRSVRRTNETTFWNYVDPKMNGFVNQFGLLKDLTDIKPPLRLSFSPYVSTGIHVTPTNDGYQSTWLRSGGMDVKYGLNESFTLDATLIPDFGQVVSDNVVNNLTPYEIKLDENRPFFTEGTDIFNKAGLFYSRRVGATPLAYDSINRVAAQDPNVEIVSNPNRTQLYNALKLSGRTPGKLGIGFFNAIGAPMYASIRDRTTGVKTKIQTELLTNYNIFVLDQALKDRSYITFTNTNVIRNGAGRDANVSGLDFSLFDKTNTYNIKGYGHYSKVFMASPYDGYTTLLKLAKVSGKWRYSAQNVIESANYDPTDLGYLQSPNQNINTGTFSYNQFTPTRNFLSYNYTLTGIYRRLYNPNQFSDFTLQAAAFWYLKNFWDIELTASYLPDQRDYFITGKPFTKYARRPQYGSLDFSGSTDSRKRLFISYDFLVSDFFKNPEKSYFIAQADIRYRFSNKLTIDLSHRHEAETDYITSWTKAPSGEPMIAFVDFKDVTSILSGVYNFTPRINFTLRVRHYWSYVPVKRVAEVDDRGLPIAATPVTGITTDVNYFNVDVFFTWDFRLGSRLIFGYKNWLGDDETVDGLKHTQYFQNLSQSLALRHGNELTVRFIYYLDYNQLRKKR